MSLSSPGLDELRAIAAGAVAEAKAWLADGAICNIPDELNSGLSNLGEGYAEGVIAERLRHRAGGEGRDGLARRLADMLELVAARLSARIPDEMSAPLIKVLREEWRRDVKMLSDAAALLAEARAQGLLDEPAAQPAGSADPPDCTAPALKVEHPALRGPRYWPLPDGRSERDELIHQVIVPWLREQIGKSREMATFTLVNDERAANMAPDSTASHAGRCAHCGEQCDADEVAQRFHVVADPGPYGEPGATRQCGPVEAHPAPDPLRSPGDDDGLASLDRTLDDLLGRGRR